VAALVAEQPELPVVLLSNIDDIAEAITAMREGAWDHVAKPIQDFGEVVAVIERVLEKARQKAEQDEYQRRLEELNRSLEAEVDRQAEELQAHNRELAALNRVSYAISDLLDMDTMLHRAIDAAIAAIEADGGAVRLLNPATQQLVIAVTRGLSESYRTSVQAIPLGEGTVGQVAQTGHPHIGSDWLNDPWLARLDEAEGFRSYLCAPLRTGQRIVGTLEMMRLSERGFTPREIELVTTIGNQIGLAVARAQYAAELVRANADLRRLDTLREQFIQNVAHELRTPLSLVHGYVEMLTEGGLNQEEQEMALDVASRRIKALVALVDSITTLQDLDSQPLRVDKVKPRDLVGTAIRMAAQRALTAQVELQDATSEELPSFPGDFTRLAQALHQLLDNACKFSPERTTVTVTTEMTPDTVAISVTDQGIGIPQEQQEHIFDRFYQADGSSRRRYGGTGLGLAIAKEICNAHGGDLTVKSEPGQGSVFAIHLPRHSDIEFSSVTPDSAV
jgi:signal transduction histidine kinase